jgi:precorrin-6x reductase
MKGAKELAEHCREEAARQFGYFGAEERRSVLSDTIAHLDAKAAIDSAVPGEIVALEQRVECLKAADEATLKYLGMARNERDAARAEVERLKAERAALAQENARLINEVGALDLAAREQRQRAEVLARGLAAYRVGGYTQAQLWENEEGKRS